MPKMPLTIDPFTGERTVTMQIDVRISRKARAKWWLARQFIRLACWILNMRSKIETEVCDDGIA